MANDHNLIPFHQRTESEQREIRRKGGLASGKARRQKADLKKAFQILLTSEVKNEQMKSLLLNMELAPTNEMALSLVMLQKALQGDVSAFKQIKDLLDASVDD
ncbi:hypothetical protein ACS60R_05920 [Streptococcus suis]|uniref:hypothetical protein n=1 Tax=Streptococcus suis TaxID=1307 RepID=UPI000CF5AEDB|nr:hypothetical protein [Streptococcus suis]NQJ67314.1 hypothetical protein [Streptococcus suis]